MVSGAENQIIQVLTPGNFIELTKIGRKKTVLFELFSRTSCYLEWIAQQYGLTATSTDHKRSESWSTGCPEIRGRTSQGKK